VVTKPAVPKPAAPKRAAPKQAASKQAAPKETAPKQAAPKQAAPKQPAPKQPAPKEIATTRWRFLVAYDGQAFRGFAAQPNQVTVAGNLAEALARTTRMAAPPQITCAGRTDAGVHARGQVIHADLPADLPKIRRGGTTRPMDALDLVQAVNRQISPAVVVKEGAPAPEGFDARRSATGRRYRYLIWNGPVGDPLLAPVSWHVPGQLDLKKMAAASDVLVGEHDFGAFCRRPPGTARGEPVLRRVRRAAWTVMLGEEVEDVNAAVGPTGTGRLLRFEIEADSFCQQMVRSLVAQLVAVGGGGPTSADVVASLRSGDRSGLPAPAPPYGLCLVSVSYLG
jgi:tRNA pseudouridine38-40 synthase